MIYLLAKKDIVKYITVPVLISTTCSNKTTGHQWEWCNKQLSKIIKLQHPSLNSPIVQCVHCNKVSCSM